MRASAQAVTSQGVIGRMLLVVAIVIVVARPLGLLLIRLKEPPVLAEIAVGIGLGPAVLGAVWPQAMHTLLPADVRGTIVAIGGVGLVLFMFLVGLEFDVGAARRQDRALVAISCGSVLLPFALGGVLAALLHETHAADNRVAFVPFALFIATALSITAFPVLARIVLDSGLEGVGPAQLALGSAALQDVAGWLLLAVSLATFTAGSAFDLVRLALELAAFLAVLVYAVRPILRRTSNQAGLAIVAAGLFASAATTQLIGLYSVLGAFAFGVIVPRRAIGRPHDGFDAMIRPLTMTVLLPMAFVLPGLSFTLDGFSASRVAEVVLIVACACIGKVVGAGVPARMVGFSRSDAVGIGVLLNTRGLVEIIVLQVGLTAGIIDRQLFSEMLIMALVTTLMTGPLVRRTRMWEQATHDRAGLGPSRVPGLCDS